MLYYEIIVTDKFGRVLVREKRKARSYLKAYSQLIYTGMTTLSQTVKDINGDDRASSGSGYYLLAVRSAAGVTDYGIRVGAGNTPVDISDYKLETPSEEGTGVGQLSHFACDISLPSVSASESAFTVSRLCINVSGGGITVREIGIYASLYGPSLSYYACIARDVLGTPVVVPDGGAITVIYTIKAVE